MTTDVIIRTRIKIITSVFVLCFSLLSQAQSIPNKTINSKGEDWEQVFTYFNKWIKKFKNTLFLAQDKTDSTETILTFELKEKLNTDSVTIVDFAKAVNGRLKGLYHHPIRKEDIEIAVSDNLSAPSYLYLKLYGSFDSTAVVEALNRKMNSSDFVFSKGDTAVSDIRKQIDRLQKRSNQLVLSSPADNTAYSANKTTEIAIGVQKDTLAIKNLLKQLTIPATKTLYLDKGMSLGDNLPVRLFLFDKIPLITANELSSCSMQFDERGFPGVTIVLNKTGKEKLAAYSRQNIGRMLAIVIKGEILATPVIVSEIPDGSLFLSGGMTVEYVYHFLNKLGYLYPVPLNFIGFKK